MEPIMQMEVVTPEESMGDVIGDLNKRRGQVEGMETSRTGARIVKAKFHWLKHLDMLLLCVLLLQVVLHLLCSSLTTLRFLHQLLSKY